MLHCEVAVGRTYKTKDNMTDLKGAPPAGYDSVHGQTGAVLNFDEVVVYKDEAVIPRFVLIYEVTYH